MKTTKENVFEFVQKQLMTNSDYKDGISTKIIADYFQLQRSNVSTLLNELVKDARLEKTNTRPVLYYLPQKEAGNELNTVGKAMIGTDGSLANALQVAKAAILYPNNSLNVLVTAKPGSGTTHFVHTLYLYGKEAGVFSESAPIYKINCRHYKNNIEELDEKLFSPKNIEDSLFAKSRGGMLFIDNAELLNSTEKSRLSEFLESGLLFSEDRKDFMDANSTFLVLSCGPNGYAEFSQRMSMVIQLPDLASRPLSEKLALINYFFMIEANNAKKNIEVKREIVDPKIIHMVTKIMDACKNELQIEIQPQVFYGLCLHMNSLLTLQLNQSRVDDDQIVHIVQEYTKEYGISIQLGQMFKDAFDIELPIEEIVIIAMFLIKDEEDTEGHPVLLYIFHGKGVATSLRDVTNTLTHTNNVYAYDLCLEKDSATALQEIKTLVQRIDDGQGIVVIYDMGSIKTMLDTISEETDIKIRYIYFPITLLGLDVARKCSQETDLEYLYHTTMREMKTMLQMNDSRKEIIITLCHTGEGGAFQLKQYIDQYSNLGFKTVPLAISKREELISQVMALKKIYRIHCFVGTYDPKLMGIPFVSMTKVFENKPEAIDKILMFEPIQSKQLDYSAVYSFLEEQFKCISVSKLKSILPSIIDELEIIYSLTPDQKVGLFVHIACLLENCKQGVCKQACKDADTILEDYPEDFKVVSKVLKPLEKAFKVIIDDNQMAAIIMILNKL